MRIKVEFELRRPARRTVALLLGLLLVGVPSVALANHQFPDVPSTYPFHNEIGAIAKAGVTTGFADGNYHPNDPVSRGAMAAFMHRGFGRVGLVAGGAPNNTTVSVPVGQISTADVVIRRITVTVPGASNSFTPNQLVYLQGEVAFATAMNTTAQGCPCMFDAIIRDTTSLATSTPQYMTFESTSSAAWNYNYHVEALFAAPPGARTYELLAGLNARAASGNAASFIFHRSSSLSATTFPFGPTGASTP
jgi:hypothetical protein